MAVIHSFYCESCDAPNVEAWTDDVPICCGKPRKIAFLKVNSPEWGSPRHIPTLRAEPFESRSELKAYTEKRGLSLGASAEKVGGARNEEHLNTGKKFSYTGSPKS